MKFSSVSSKSLHIGGIKKTFTKPQNWLSFFILLYIVVLFIVLIISCLVRRFKYICSRHSQGGITIDFAFQLCNYSFKWNQKLKKIFGFWAYRNLIIYATHKKTSFFHQICIFVHFQLVIDTCLFQQHLHFKNIERFSSFVFGIITLRWNCVLKYKNIVIK